MPNVWLLITIWGSSGSPTVHHLPFNDMAACELATQNAPGALLAERLSDWQRNYGGPGAALGGSPPKPGATFVCLPTTIQ